PIRQRRSRKRCEAGWRVRKQVSGTQLGWYPAMSRGSINRPETVPLSGAADQYSPPEPGPSYFDPGRNAWVLSRYADVMAAFREPSLWPVPARGEDQSKTR